jgi:hypothetical protein
VTEQILERATEPRYTAAEPQILPPIAEKYEEAEAEIVEIDDPAGEPQVAAAAAANPAPQPASDENKNDLDLPAFMRRERRLFQ